MTFEQKAKVNLNVADMCYMQPERICVAVSRYYYAALLYAKHLIKAHYPTYKPNIGKDSHRQIWDKAKEIACDKNIILHDLLDAFDGSYRKLRVAADYDECFLESTKCERIRKACKELEELILEAENG